jgi:heme oxygenase
MSLLLTLRSATRDAHERLEARLDVLTRCAEPAAYATLLVDLRAVYAPLERALDASAATAIALPDWPQRRKTGWLDADLAALGAGRTPEQAPTPLPTAEDVAGVSYVLEGATLGGAVILRRLTSLWPTPLPHRFFTAYGAQRGAMWNAFRRHVDALPLDPGATVAAAERTFAAFDRSCVGARS